MVDRRMSLKTLFIFTTLLAIALACVVPGFQGDYALHTYIHIFGWLARIIHQFVGWVRKPLRVVGQRSLTIARQ